MALTRLDARFTAGAGSDQWPLAVEMAKPEACRACAKSARSRKRRDVGDAGVVCVEKSLLAGHSGALDLDLGEFVLSGSRNSPRSKNVTALWA
jgi:hypothetical protein